MQNKNHISKEQSTVTNQSPIMTSQGFIANYDMRSTVEKKLNISAFLAGAIIIAGLGIGGFYLQGQGAVNEINELISPFLVIIAVGLGMGHYFGTLIHGNSDEDIASMYFGAFTSLFIFLFIYINFNVLSMLMVFMALGSFLFHTSGLIDKSEYVKLLLGFVSGEVSPIFIAFVAFLKYGLPLAATVTLPPLIQNTLKIITVLLLLVTLAVIKILYSVWKKKRRYEKYSHMMYSIGRDSALEEEKED